MASVAGQSGARPRRSSPVPTKAETQTTNIPMGAEKSSIFIRGPCGRESIIESVVVKEKSTQDGDNGFGNHLPRANDENRCGAGEQASSPDEVYGLIVNTGEADRTAAVVLSRRLWQQREELALPFALPFRHSSV